MVIGFSTRNIVCSGNKAEYNMYTIDAFCDQDTIECSISAQELPKNFDMKHENATNTIIDMIHNFGTHFDGIILGSGFELMDLSMLEYPILSSELKQRQTVQNKLILAKKLKKLNILHPHVYTSAEKIEFPVIIKPCNKGGGIFNRIAHDKEELQRSINELINNQSVSNVSDIIIQAYIEGIPTSVSLIATHDKVVPIVANEQLIGESWLTNMPYAYCGNITPYKGDHHYIMLHTAEKLVKDMKLIGSIGVDFIVNEQGVYVLEINPRFQGSLDTVEKSTGLNLCDAHIKAFNSNIVPEQYEIKQWAGRCIIYADKETYFTDQLIERIKQYSIADIPKRNYIAKKNEPIISLLATGSKREDIIITLQQKTKEIKTLLL